MRMDRNYLAGSHQLLHPLNNENTDTSNLTSNLVHLSKLPKLYDYKIDKRPRPNTHREAPVLEKQTRPSLVTERVALASSFQEKLKEQMTEVIAGPYSEDVLTTLRCRMDTPKGFLVNHDISSGLRAKMVDWMIEVLSSYKMSEDSFFRSVYYMDKFLERAPRKHETSELHLVGVTTMFMATKYEEIHGLKLSTVFEKIAHKKIPKTSILNKESQILSALEFAIEKPTTFDLVKHIVYSLEMNISKTLKEYLDKVVLYLSKMCVHHYDLLHQFQYRNLAAGCVYVGLKTLEQVDKAFVPEEYLKGICRHSGLSEQDILQVGSKILALAKNFGRLYPSLQNLKTFNGFCLNKYQ